MGKHSMWPSTHLSLLKRIRIFEDQAAWRQFVDIYGPLIYRISRMRGLQDADAQDVTQEVFKQVAKAIVDFEYNRERGRFRNWLGTTTQNEINRCMKKSAKQGRGHGGYESLQLDELQSPDFEKQWTDEFNSRVYRASLSRIREHFDPETWNAFDLLWNRNWNSKDVAVKVNRPVGWVYKAKFRVLKRLKEEVEIIISEFGSIDGI